VLRIRDREGGDDVASGARARDGAGVIDAGGTVGPQLDRDLRRRGGGREQNPRAPAPVRGFLECDAAEGGIVQVGQVLPVVDVLPDALEGGRDPPLVDGDGGVAVYGLLRSQLTISSSAASRPLSLGKP
jgi:hypothetical protein